MGSSSTTTGLCASCGTQLPPDSLFCKQVRCAGQTGDPGGGVQNEVTVLFADVVHSMDIAKAVGAERLPGEIMASLLDRASAVVGRYGGPWTKFTGDGVMAVFGAPVARRPVVRWPVLEIHTAIIDLVDEVSHRDGIDLRLRVGLKPGQVIGEIGRAERVTPQSANRSAWPSRMEPSALPAGDAQWLHRPAGRALDEPG